VLALEGLCEEYKSQESERTETENRGRLTLLSGKLKKFSSKSRLGLDCASRLCAGIPHCDQTAGRTSLGSSVSKGALHAPMIQPRHELHDDGITEAALDQARQAIGWLPGTSESATAF
jgi:hypothetical protein